MAQVPAVRTPYGGRLARRVNPLQQLQRDFDTLLGRMWSGLLAPMEQDFESLRLWDFDVTENDKEIAVRAEMPGFEENELDVQISNNVLTIKGEKEQKGNGHEESRIFYRRVILPNGINADKVQASYQNGVLELRIPRAEEAQPKRIKVETQQAATGPPSAQAANPGQQANNPGEKTTPQKAQN